MNAARFVDEGHLSGEPLYESSWGMHPRLQTLTVAEMLAGKTIDYPRGANPVTFKRAPRAKTSAGTAVELPLIV